MSFLQPEKLLIGMLHAAPLPGSPHYFGNWDAVVTGVLNDAETLIEGGFGALLLENFGDAPFFPKSVPAQTIAQMTRLAVEIRNRFDVPLGINVLRNDGLAALAVAAAARADFIRVNVLIGARVTDQGIIEGIAHELGRLRTSIDADSVMILADVDVKHSAPLARRPIQQEAVETVERGGADGIIVSGPGTGLPIDLDQLRAVRQAVKGVPVFVGSGASADTIRETEPFVDGWIVGTSLKRDNCVTNPVEADRVHEFVEAFRQAVSSAE